MVARFLFFFAAFVLPLTNALGLALNATRDEVIQELGQPLAHAQLGSREILTYPKKVRVELEDGHVVSADHIVLKIVDPTPTPEPTVNPVETETAAATPTPVPPITAASVAAAPTPSASPAPAPTTTPEPTPLPTPTLAPTSAPTTTPAAFSVTANATPSLSPTPAAQAPATAVKKSIAPTPSPVAEPFHPVSLFDATELPMAGKIMLLAFHFAVTLLVLYFAFRIWNLDALPSGVIIIALIDTALHGIFEALGPMTSGLSTMSAVENGIPAAVMIFTVRHFSFSKKIPEAVRVAAAVKAVVFAVKLIATAALLDFVFPVH